VERSCYILHNLLLVWKLVRAIFVILLILSPNFIIGSLRLSIIKGRVGKISHMRQPVESMATNMLVFRKVKFISLLENLRLRATALR